MNNKKFFLQAFSIILCATLYNPIVKTSEYPIVGDGYNSDDEWGAYNQPKPQTLRDFYKKSSPPPQPFNMDGKTYVMTNDGVRRAGNEYQTVPKTSINYELEIRRAQQDFALFGKNKKDDDGFLSGILNKLMKLQNDASSYTANNEPSRSLSGMKGKLTAYTKLSRSNIVFGKKSDGEPSFEYIKQIFYLFFEGKNKLLSTIRTQHGKKLSGNEATSFLQNTLNTVTDFTEQLQKNKAQASWANVQKFLMVAPFVKVDKDYGWLLNMINEAKLKANDLITKRKKKYRQNFNTLLKEVHPELKDTTDLARKIHKALSSMEQLDEQEAALMRVEFYDKIVKHSPPDMDKLKLLRNTTSELFDLKPQTRPLDGAKNPAPHIQGTDNRQAPIVSLKELFEEIKRITRGQSFSKWNKELTHTAWVASRNYYQNNGHTLFEYVGNQLANLFEERDRISEQIGQRLAEKYLQTKESVPPNTKAAKFLIRTKKILERETNVLKKCHVETFGKLEREETRVLTTQMNAAFKILANQFPEDETVQNLCQQAQDALKKLGEQIETTKKHCLKMYKNYEKQNDTTTMKNVVKTMLSIDYEAGIILELNRMYSEETTQGKNNLNELQLYRKNLAHILRLKPEKTSSLKEEIEAGVKLLTIVQEYIKNANNLIVEGNPIGVNDETIKHITNVAFNLYTNIMFSINKKENGQLFSETRKLWNDILECYVEQPPNPETTIGQNEKKEQELLSEFENALNNIGTNDFNFVIAGNCVEKMKGINKELADAMAGELDMVKNKWINEKPSCKTKNNKKIEEEGENDNEEN